MKQLVGVRVAAGDLFPSHESAGTGAAAGVNNLKKLLQALPMILGEQFIHDHQQQQRQAGNNLN